jgi:hypothetical protein
MDAADRAQQEEQARLDAAVSRRRPEVSQPAARGRCMFCDEPAAERFCDSYCREDYIRLELKRENDRIVKGAA